MKKITTFAFVFILFCSFANSEDIQWYSWDEGYELAESQNKPILVFVHATWCHVCKRLDDKTFNNEDIAPLITRDYIPVKLDVEDESQFSFKDEKFQIDELLSKISKKPVMGIPTILFYKPGGRKTKPIPGLKDPEEMQELLSENL